MRWLSVFLAACAAEPGPQLDEASPPAAAHAATVTLSGARLCGTSSDCMAVAATIQFGLELPAIDAQISAYSATSATILVPANALIGKTAIVVTVNNRSSNALAFEVLQ